jgi:hypothetical protein
MRACIVGHGPSLLNAGRGPEIDKYDLIVKMPDTKPWKTPENHGSRIDVYCTTGQPAKIRRLRRCNEPPRLATYMWKKRRRNGLPFKGRMVNRFDPTLIQDFKIKNAQKINNIWQDKFAFTRPGYPYFTRGTLAVIITAEYYKPDTIMMLGCDNLKIGSSENFTDGPKWQVRTDGHNYKAEHDFIKYCVQPHYKIKVLYE